MSNWQEPQTADEYIDLVRKLAAITDKAMERVERGPEFASESDRKLILGRLADAVETISSLRGDTSVFHDSRPEGLIEHQKEMYRIEDQLRKRLVSLGYKYPSPPIHLREEKEV